jgi:hypothetical protein
VRLGTKSSIEFIQILNKKNEEIQQLFLKLIQDLTKKIPIKAMLGDSTITDQKTFDPNLIQNFYKKMVRNLPDWEAHDVSISNNEDIRRIFVKLNVREGNYMLSCHLSLQFHVLLFYKADAKVIENQKELSEIIDKTKNMENKIADNSDQFILEKLKNMGYKDLDSQNLFEVFFENDEIREKIYKEIEKNTDVNFKALSKRKIDLFNELDNLLIETYQTTPVLIDEARLVTGEEGCLCNLELEFIKNKIKEGVFDPKKIPITIKEKIIERLDEIKKNMNI